MNILDMFNLAFANLKHRRIRSWLTLIGIFAGIAAIVALISLGQGLESAIADQFASFGVDSITITGAGSSFGPPGTNAIGELNDHDIRLLEELPEIDYVIARYIKAGELEYRDIVINGFIASVPPGEDTDRLYNILNLDVASGREVRGEDVKKIVLGASVDFDEEYPQVGHKVTINDEVFTVAGVLKKKGNPIFDTSILMSEQDVKELFDIQEDYSFLVAKVKQGEDIVASREIISRTMRRDRGLEVGEEDFEVSSPQDALDSLNNVLVIIQVLLIGVAAISLLVGAIGILNTMYTAVLERNREIGIMKAIGGTKRDILGLFLIESGLLGFAGGVLGLLMGMGIAKGVELAAFAAFGESIIKTTFPTWLIVGSLLFAFLLGALSGTVPAKQASDLDPVEALRK